MIKKNLIICIAGVPLEFIFTDSSMYSRVKKRYHGYVIKKSIPIISFVCSFTSKKISQTKKVKLTYKDKAWKLIRNDFSCSWNKHSGALILRRSIYAFDACLRICFATVLPEAGGILFHGSSIAIGASAHLFVGPSEAGKTTIARLSGKKVLNDEITAIKCNDNEIQAFGTPFWGEMGTGPVYKQKFILKSVNLIRKSAQTRKKLKIPVEALPKLLQCCCYFGKAPNKIKELLTVMLEIIEHIPIFDLQFQKSSEFLKVLHK